MTDTAKTTDSPEIIDIQHVTCGLVPLMETHLGGAIIEGVQALEFKIRQGIETELWNAFGTGGNWRLTEIKKDLFFDVACFTHVEQDELDPLGLMEF